jgi:predicted aldo/keto reductase-like oxidoreductase
MKSPISRREFLESTTAGIAAITAAGSLKVQRLLGAAKDEKDSIPKRLLGKTGVMVSQLAFGGGSRFMMYKSEEEALQVLNWVIDNGINYLDTAHVYGDGESERRYGLVMKDRRKEVFLVTKLPARERDEFLRQFELSLKRLQTDHLDLVHIHSLGKMDDVDKIGEPAGVYEALAKLKEQKVTRFIGFTSHTDGAAARAAIERYEFDCCMMQLNASKAGGFEDLALPAALKKSMGIVAMKATAQEKLLGEGAGKAAMEELLRYSMSLPVAAVNLGMPRFEWVKQNVELARSFKPLTPQEMKAIQDKTAPARASLESFFVSHRDTQVA